MHPSRKRCNQAFSLLFILRCSLVAAFPSKPGDLSPVLAGRDIDTAASAFNSQINQDGSVPGSLIAELFPTGETTPNENPEDTLLEYGDGNPRAELSSADQREIPPCSQNPDGSTQVPSGKGRFKRQKPEICLPDAHQANPGAVEQKIPGKGQTQGHERPLSPGQQWEPFLQFQKPDTGVTNQGKCIKPEYPVAVCFAPGRISKIPSSLLLGGVMGILEPVSFGSEGVDCAAGEEKWCCSFVFPNVDVNRLQVVPLPPPEVRADIQSNLDRWTGYTCVKQVSG